MRRYLRFMAIPILLIAIAGGCRPNNIEPENPIDPIDKPDDRPDGAGDKPDVPTDEYYKGWNTTGEYLVPEETPFFNLQKTYELFDPKVTSTSFNTKFELSLDYYFDTEKPKSGKEAVDGEGKEIRTNTIYPLNRMKSYTATYSASECDGETILTIEDSGNKITEKGELTRVVVYDGYPIQATYIVDSDFPELFEMGDFEFTGSMGYVTYYMKYYAGECLFDPVLDNLDYIRWDRDMNNNHLDFIFNEEDFGDLEDCVHVTGPECSVFFPHTDITYWMNIPVKVATGYLDPEQKHYNYLTLKSYKILDDSSEDRAKKDGDTEYEPNPTVPMEALDDEDGTWGDFIGGGGGGDDDDDLAGYYVRVNEEPESWEGKYLIVDEKSQNFFLSNINGIYNTFNGAYTGSLNNGRIKRVSDSMRKVIGSGTLQPPAKTGWTRMMSATQTTAWRIILSIIFSRSLTHLWQAPLVLNCHKFPYSTTGFS